MGQNNYPPSADQTIRDLQQRVKALEAAAQTRAPLNTITGGTFEVQDAAGNTYLQIGRVGPNLTDGSPQYGILINRQNGGESVGNKAFAMVNFTGNVPAQAQGISMYDASGNQIFGDDVASEFGLAFPYLPMPMFPANTSIWPSTTSSSMSDMWIGFPSPQNPKVTIWGYMNAPIGTNANIQLVSNSTVIVPPQSSTGIGSPQLFELGPAAYPQVVGAGFGQTTDLRLQAARTAGTGTVQIGLLACYGSQT